MSKPSNMMGIGTIGNYYGNLRVARDDEGRFFWGIEDHDGCEWEQIPKSLYDELVKFEESQRPTAPPPQQTQHPDSAPPQPTFWS